MKKIFRFRNVIGLYADTEGVFHHENKPVKKVCNNGSLAVQVGNSKFGVKKLRKMCYIDFIDDYKMPF